MLFRNTFHALQQRCNSLRRGDSEPASEPLCSSEAAGPGTGAISDPTRIRGPAGVAWTQFGPHTRRLRTGGPDRDCHGGPASAAGPAAAGTRDFKLLGGHRYRRPAQAGGGGGDSQ